MATASATRIAVNVMRARLTLVGFSIAIVSFQFPELFRLPGGMPVEGLNHGVHLRADIALLIALTSSLIALVAYIGSAAIDEAGVCDHWSFIAGDLLMYLGLANVATGFFAPLNHAFVVMTADLPQLEMTLGILPGVVMVSGALVWTATLYIGPAITLWRSPFSRRTNLSLAFCYLVLLGGLFWLNHQVSLAELGDGQPLLIYEVIQPVLW